MALQYIRIETATDFYDLECNLDSSHSGEITKVNHGPLDTPHPDRVLTVRGQTDNEVVSTMIQKLGDEPFIEQ